MADEFSTLNHRAIGLIPSLLPDYVAKQAQIAAAAADHLAPRHGQALTDLAEHLRGRKPTDERVYALACIGAALGSSEQYQPGPQQQALLARLGVDRPAPPSEATLNELVAAAVDDYIAHAQAELGKARSELNRAEAEAGRVAKAEERAEAAKQRAEGLSDELETATAERASLREQMEHLSAMLGEPAGATDDAPAEGKNEPPRRTKVEGHTGVYERETAEGEVVYEIGWREDGKQKWLMIGPDLDEAITTRANLTEPKEGPA